MKSYPISSPRSIIIGGDFNANTRMRNKDHLLNNIVGSYAKSDINDNASSGVMQRATSMTTVKS